MQVCDRLDEAEPQPRAAAIGSSAIEALGHQGAIGERYALAIVRDGDDRACAP